MMRKRCVLLATMLSVFFLPSITGADHLNGNKGHGGGGNSSPTAPVFVLMDSGNPSKQVGEVIKVNLNAIVGIHTPTVETLVSAEDTVGTKLGIILGVFKNEIAPNFGHVGLLIFEENDTDCDGTPWIVVQIRDDGIFKELYTPSAVVSFGNERRLYGVTSTDTQEVTLRSFLSTSGECTVEGNPRNIDAYPTEILDQDLHVTYPPDYSLQLLNGN